RSSLTTEAGSADLSAARRQEITTRLADIDVLTGVEGDSAIAPRITTVQAELEPLYTERDLALDGLQSAIDAGYLPELDAMRAEGGLALTNYLNQDANRLSQVGWASDVSSYIKTTLIHGRPGSESVWPAPMVSWSQLGGGPLREDQIDDIVAFLVNYNKGDAWTLEDLASVQQFAKLHGGGEAAPAVPPVGSNVDAALPIVEPMVGDPVRGEALYTGTQRTETGDRLGCSSCHAGGAQAPATEGTWERTETERLTLAQFADYTAEHYLIESIIAPDVYVVPGYASGVMPQNLGENMSAKDLADIIEYLHSTSPDYVAPDPSTITPLTQPGGAMPAAPAAMGTAEAGMTDVPMMDATAEVTVPVMVEPEGEQPDLPTPEPPPKPLAAATHNIRLSTFPNTPV
ncbi:MAG: cytochrome c, partial [Nitrospiraceae bacterium]|nr:cytochrome c [Nitrospiraceae bacterium]